MKLSKQLKSKITERLVLRINELYHDFENRLYNLRHPYLSEMETERWISIASKYIWNKTPIVCFDYGTGTGFVPTIIGEKLKSTDKLICTDLSQEILNVCENSLKNLNLQCETSFIKANGRKIPCQDNSVDILTINSVLHHILDITNFAEESNRVLKKEGLLIVVHEPNGDTMLPYKHKTLLYFLDNLFNPQNFIFRFVEKFETIERFLRQILNFLSESYKIRNKFLNEIADILIKEDLIDIRLRGVEIQQIVDIQTEKGFFRAELMKNFEPYLELIEWNTFNYIDLRFNKITNKVNTYLHNKYPDKGHTISFILKKR